MSFLKRLAAATGYVFKGSLGDTGNPSGGLARLLGGMDTAAGIAVSDASAMRVSAVYACVRVIAEDIAKLRPRIWREQEDGSRVELIDHPLHAILDAPHRLLTPVNLLMAMGAALGFRGNAIAVILRDDRGRPVGLWPVHPGSVTIYEAMDGGLFYAISRRTTLESAILRDVCKRRSENPSVKRPDCPVAPE